MFTICPACMNTVPAAQLGDEVWCIRDTKNYKAELCEAHKDKNFFVELQTAITNTKAEYDKILCQPRCTCIDKNLNSQMDCRIHGISAQLTRTQME